MTTEQCVIAYIAAMRAEIAALEQYRKDGSWHTEECNCHNCKALRKWYEMGFWNRLNGKFHF